MKKILPLSALLFCCILLGNAQPFTIVVSGPTDICGANTTSLTVSPATGTLYRWFVYPAYPTGMPAHVGPIFNSPFSGVFLCEITTMSGVFVTINTVTIRNTADAYVPAPFQTVVCFPGTVTLFEQISSIYLMGFYNSYQWKKDGVSIPGANFWNYTATSTGSYSCVVSNNCGSSTTNSVIITVDPVLPNPSSMSASGPTTFCNGGSVMLTVPFNAAYIYQWLKNGVIISGATISTYLATMNGVYTCNVSNACGLVIVGPETVTVTLYPEAYISVSGPVNFSFGSNVTLYAPPGCFGCLYQWKNSGSDIPGATSYSYTTCSSGSFTIWISSSGCTNESSPTVVTVSPPSIGMSGPTSFNFGESVTLYAPPVCSGCLYQWKNSGSPISGATAGIYSVCSSGSYSVAIVASGGCSAETPPTIVTVSPLSISAGGPTTFCSGGTVTLYGPLTCSGCTYQWKSGGTNIPGATSVNFIANVTGTYSLAVVTSGGCTSESGNIIVTVNPSPTVSFSGLAASYLCVNPPATLSGTPAGGNFTGLGITGSNFDPGLAGIGGPYSITYSYINGFGCYGSQSQSTNVTGGYNCAQPQNITISNIAATSARINWKYSSASQFQVRYKKVSGGPYTTKTFTWTPCITNYTLTGLKKNTAYLISIRALCASGNSAYSTEVTFSTLPARLGDEEEFDVTVYPIPASNELFIEILCDHEQLILVNLVDPAGRTVLQEEFQTSTVMNDFRLDVTSLKPGFYMAVIRAMRETRVIPVVKQ